MQQFSFVSQRRFISLMIVAAGAVIGTGLNSAKAASDTDPASRTHTEELLLQKIEAMERRPCRCSAVEEGRPARERSALAETSHEATRRAAKSSNDLGCSRERSDRLAQRDMSMFAINVAREKEQSTFDQGRGDQG
ncbi:hypothetical protein [Bradyrhizobium sp. USDA 3364]